MKGEAVAVGCKAGGTAVSTFGINVDVPEFLQASDESFPCGEDPEAFFPKSYSLTNRRAILYAKGLCADCPVKDLCLEWAVARPGLDGIWAATTPLERRRMRGGRVA